MGKYRRYKRRLVESKKCGIKLHRGYTLRGYCRCRRVGAYRYNMAATLVKK